MAPKTQHEDPYMAALAVVIKKVDEIAATQASHAKAIKWITSGALVVIGAVAGPEAVMALTTGAV